MNDLSPLQSALWILNIAAGVAIAGRLFYAGLHRPYRWFFAYWILTGARSLVLIPFTGETYATIWLYTQPLLWLANVLVVLEIFSLTLGAHRGIYTIARWFLFGAITLASCLAFISLIPTWGDPKHPFQLALIAERGIRTSLALFLLLMLVFMRIYPMPLSRNLVVHSFIFTAFFLSSSLALLYRNLGGGSVGALASQLNMAFGFAAQLAWLFLLSKQGELVPSQIRFQRDPSDEKRFLEQLDAINATLLKAGRK